jgi:hypothetical protein
MSRFEIYVMMAILAIPAIGIVWLFRRIRGPREGIEVDESSRRYVERLRSPDFNFMEGHFGFPMPSILKDFYASDLVTSDCEFEINGNRFFIAFFEPIDRDSLRESWSGCERFIGIANDGCGNQYVFDPATESKAVLFHDHETGTFTAVTPTLAGFLAVVRDAITDPKAEDP